MEHIAFLKKLGLSERASTVYLTLLQNGRMSVTDLSKKTKLYRTMVYEAIAELEREGLATMSLKGKYKRYSAESPKKLEAKFLELSNQFDDELAQLTMLERAPMSCRPIVKYVEGQKGISAIYDDIVETLGKGEVFYRYSSANVGAESQKRNYLSKKYRLLRDQKQLERKVITNVPNNARKNPRLERAVKVIPPDFDLFAYNISQIIYANKVAVIDYNTETAVVIENESVAKFQAKIFELLFRKL